MIYIKKLRIKNFKSIEEEKIDFNRGLNILVGPNNAGKTNIIEAVDLLLGDNYLPKFEPTTDYFFNGEENREIVIEALLEGDDNELKKILLSWSGTQMEIRFKYSKENKGCFEVKEDNQWERQYNKPFGYYWTFEDKLFFLRVKSLRNIMEIAPIRWKSPLKYFKEIIIKKAPKENLDQVVNEINEAKNKLSEIEEVKKIISNLLQISRDQTDIRNIYLSPASTKYSDILNEMKILIDDGYLSEVNKKGLGTQNLIIISLFRVMAKYIRDEEKKFIIYGIDEPEIGLHPHSQRQLLSSLNKLSEYSQVIITTHSDHLIDVSEIDSVIRISKEQNKTQKYKINLNTSEKKILEIHGVNLEEIFFAKRILIVEGETELGFFSEASRKIIEIQKTYENEEKEENYSFDYNSVSVVDGEGDKIIFFIRIAKTLKIPFIVLIDEDKIGNDDFFKGLLNNNLIKQDEYEKLENNNSPDVKKRLLENLGIDAHSPFEKTISYEVQENGLEKVKQAIDFVRKNWGKDFENMEKVNSENITREHLFNLLKQNKRWRIGRAIAQYLDKDDMPQFYINLIKKVSKL